MDATVPPPKAPPAAADDAPASPATPNPSAPVANGEAAAPGAAGPTVPSKQRRRQRNKKRTPANGGSAPAAAAEVQKLTHLVIDSGAIIKGAGMTLASSAEASLGMPSSDLVNKRFVSVVVGAC